MLVRASRGMHLLSALRANVQNDWSRCRSSSQNRSSWDRDLSLLKATIEAIPGHSEWELPDDYGSHRAVNMTKAHRNFFEFYRPECYLRYGPAQPAFARISTNAYRIQPVKVGPPASQPNCRTIYWVSSPVTEGANHSARRSPIIPVRLDSCHSGSP